MFEKAREFKEKFYISKRSSSAVRSAESQVHSILEKQLDRYTHRCASLRLEIAILESEIALIQTEIDEFLLSYYEKFSQVVLENWVDLTNDSAVRTNFGKGVEDNILLMNRRAAAFDDQLKKTYRRLLKMCHPDTAESDLAKIYFDHVQSSFRQGALEELFFVELKIQEQVFEGDDNIVARIEKLESKAKFCKSKVIKLIDKKQQILRSIEYKLFLKFKLSEVRGYNFFEEMLKKTSFNSIQH